MGSGGVGGWLGVLLANAGNDVSLIARGQHLQEIRSNGLRLLGDQGEITVKVPATSDPRDIGPVDLVIFAVKTYHNPEAVPAVRPLVGLDTAVLTLQNGVESHLQLSGALGTGHSLPGAFWSASSVQSPGVIASIGGAPRLSFGEEAGGTTRRAAAIRDIFQLAGIEVELSDDPLQVIWSKFVVLCSIAGITSASRTRIKEFMQRAEGVQLFTDAMREVDTVGRAKGVNLPLELVENSVNFIREYPDFQNSMHADFENGRATELDALNGAVVRLGRETGVPTPLNQYIYAVLTPLKDGVPT